jgi:hypothetical protein
MYKESITGRNQLLLVSDDELLQYQTSSTNRFFQNMSFQETEFPKRSPGEPFRAITEFAKQEARPI